jgi:hypothetical protein
LKNSLSALPQVNKGLFSDFFVSPKPSDITRTKAQKNVSQQIFQQLSALNLNSSINLLKSMKSLPSNSQTNDLKGATRQETEVTYYTIAIPMPDKTHQNIQLELRKEARSTNENGKESFIANITFEDATNGRIKAK